MKCDVAKREWRGVAEVRTGVRLQRSFLATLQRVAARVPLTGPEMILFWKQGGEQDVGRTSKPT